MIRKYMLWSAAFLVASAPIVLAFDFNDDDYHEVVLFEWDESRIDVVILPPVTYAAPWRLEAVQDSIQAWEDGIQNHPDTPSWLKNNLEIDVYVEGVDDIPESVLNDPEVIVTSAEPGILGIGIPSDFFGCDTFWGGPSPGQDPLGIEHQHAGSVWKVTSSPCHDNTDNVCIVVNTNWRLYNNGLYDLNAHEFGHCLGIGHVGDAGDFKSKEYPATDIMSYQEDQDQVHCVSSLNVLALQVSFADVMGQSWPTVEYPAFDSWYPYVEQDPADYSQVSCNNPDPGPLDDLTPICADGVVVEVCAFQREGAVFGIYTS